jgi:predicted DNA-binding transcriptional regulator
MVLEKFIWFHIQPQGMQPIELPEFNDARQKILAWFFAFPTQEIGLTELAIKTSVAKTTAHTVIESLLKERFLSRKVVGKSWLLRCEPKHPYNFSKKILLHMEMIYQGGILTHIHSMIPHTRAIILFGSYRKGDDTEKSDMDIAVEILGNYPPKILQAGTLPAFGYRKDIPLTLYVFTRKKIDPNLFANIANGIVLDGFLEVRT